MTTINIGNRPISITLTGTESVTVPSGEVWKVEIIVGNGSTAGGSAFKLNGASIYVGAHAHLLLSAVLVGGDKIERSPGPALSISDIFITGFVINGN